MERIEVPLEQSQEEIAHHAHHATEKWILGGMALLTPIAISNWF